MTWRSFRSDERGNMAILFAFGFTLSALVSALAVDAASLYHARRQMQAGVDLAAISAASDPARAAEIAHSVLVEARLLAPTSTEGLIVLTGRYDPDMPDMDRRFRAGMQPYNAVEVRMERQGKLHFANSFAAPPQIRARGIAAVSPQVSFSVGSRLASLNGGLVNAVLASLLGTSVSLNALDYRALADARVDALAFLDALAMQMGVTAGSYNDLLAMKAGAGTIAQALSGLTEGAARTALNTLAGAGQVRMIPIGKLLSLGALSHHKIGAAGAGGLGVDFSVLDLLTGAAAVADAKSQLSLPLGANVPGLVNLSMSLGVGEPPQGGGWFAIGPNGTVLRTAQLRLRLRADLLGGSMLGAVKLPLWLDLAHSEAMVTGATCPSPATPRGTASIAVKPGALRLALGEMSDPALANFGIAPSLAPVRVVDVLSLVRVNAAGRVEIAQTEPIALQFSSTDIAERRMRTARTSTIPSSLVGSLLGSLSVEPEILGNILGLGLLTKGGVTDALRALLAPLGPVLDITVDAVLASLGLAVGEADITVHAVRCTNPVLVG
ncbi:MAG: hypothetical protein ABS75_12885 [Pelagibacterium sp. SCN 63-23]|nr:MAG: hypothetical protein ABS75_12885 [Pelagibacterium sp. SCN 63-23]